MPAHRDNESEAFDSQSAEHKGSALRRSGKEHQRGYRKKESGWHDQ
jgi:hypothetical protein